MPFGCAFFVAVARNSKTLEYSYWKTCVVVKLHAGFMDLLLLIHKRRLARAGLHRF
jgi:hypothetical protein